MNQNVQIVKKRPRMKFSEKMAHQEQQQRQAFVGHVQNMDAQRFSKVLDSVLL